MDESVIDPNRPKPEPPVAELIARLALYYLFGTAVVLLTLVALGFHYGFQLT